MTICRLCYSSKFRRSHVRPDDFWKLLQLHYPVRCLNCGKRRFAPLWEAWVRHRPSADLNPQSPRPISK